MWLARAPGNLAEAEVAVGECGDCRRRGLMLTILQSGVLLFSRVIVYTDRHHRRAK